MALLRKRICLSPVGYMARSRLSTVIQCGRTREPAGPKGPCVRDPPEPLSRYASGSKCENVNGAALPRPEETAVNDNAGLILDAHAEEPVSRRLWLFIWLLLVPHYLALLFLWIAFL